VFWSFFLFTPLQSFLGWVQWYGVQHLSPGTRFCLNTDPTAIAGDRAHFLERTAKISLGTDGEHVFPGHAPAFVDSEIPVMRGRTPSCVLIFCVVWQLSDVLPYVWGKLSETQIFFLGSSRQDLGRFLWGAGRALNRPLAPPLLCDARFRHGRHD